MKFKVLLYLALCQSSSALAKIYIDYRNRPPEMVVTDETFNGPIIDISRELAQMSGMEIQEFVRPFFKTLAILQKQGHITLLPRTFCTSERAKTIDYLGPIGKQEKQIRFLVRSDSNVNIETYEDLKKYNIGVKLKTVYFDQFDKDPSIKKIESIDDHNMVRMLMGKRFDAMVVVDQKAAEFALKKHGLKNYKYANYAHTKVIWHYFGMNRGFPQKELLQKNIEKMVLSGRISAIYKKHNLPSPDSPGTEFPKCL